MVMLDEAQALPEDPAELRQAAEGLVALADGRAVGGVRRSLSAVLERLSARG